MSDLAKQSCSACAAGAPKLSSDQLEELQSQIPHWRQVNKSGVLQLQRIFSFSNFKEALDFANAVGELAEREDHHPKLQVEWGKTTVTWWTHKIEGLHMNDVILAAKTDALWAQSE